MDRLSAVILGVVAASAALACGSKDDVPATAPSARTDGAKVAKPQAASTDAFCDLHATDATGPAFTWPELAPGTTAPAAARSWRWVNLWATWCKPCIEEMPRVIAWRDKMAAAGKPVDLQFVSADESDDDIAGFRKDHPELLPAGPALRLASAQVRTAWLKSFKVDDGAIPIQLFVSPTGKLRCSRGGGVRDKDYAVVQQLLAE